MSLLIVDDDADVCEAICRLLQNLITNSIATCTSGRDAVRLLKGDTPYVVLLDINMPWKSGLDVLKELQPDDIKKHKIFMLTGEANDKTILDCYRNGAVGYILKPFSYENFYRALAEQNIKVTI